MPLTGFSLPDTLTDDAGNTLKGITVQVSGPGGYSGTAVSDAVSGILRLGPLPVGDYTITYGARSVVLPVVAVPADVELAFDRAAAALPTATASGTYATVVKHGATATTVRPVGATLVEWVGTVAPSNAVADDLWQDTSTAPAVLKRRNATVFETVGGGGALELISRTVLAASAATVDLTSIPQTYETLVLFVVGRTDGATSPDKVGVRYNGDATGANYASNYVGSFAGPNARDGNNGSATYAIIGEIPGSAAAATDAAAAVRMELPGYSRTVFRKRGFTQAGSRYDAAAGNQIVSASTHEWMSTAAVSQVTVLPNAGNFVIGTVVALYGLKGV